MLKVTLDFIWEIFSSTNCPVANKISSIWYGIGDRQRSSVHFLVFVLAQGRLWTKKCVSYLFSCVCLGFFFFSLTNLFSLSTLLSTLSTLISAAIVAYAAVTPPSSMRYFSSFSFLSLIFSLSLHSPLSLYSLSLHSLYA
jgi:hypothetical protein